MEDENEASTMVKDELRLQIQKLLQIASRSKLQSLDLLEFMEEKCLDESLAQRLSSFNEKLDNF